jgi:hypothetical protein
MVDELYVEKYSKFAKLSKNIIELLIKVSCALYTLQDISNYKKCIAV